MNESDFQPRLPLFQALAAAGAAAVAVGAALAPQRTWPALLMAGFLLTGFGLAGLFFVALQYACGAGWSTSFRRVPEAMTAILPWGALALAAVFLLHPSTYPWLHAHSGGFKQFWLRLPFFLARAGVYVAAWLGFAALIVRSSRRQDRDGDPAHTRRNVKLSIAFLVVFALTFWLASYDWIMSLEPGWASTIFGVYNFAGMFSGGLALLILLVLWLRRSGPLRDFVNQEHLHDLGKLLFAFTTFWMYIWFSQYMLIWYADITEEAAYFVRRGGPLWEPLFLVNMLLNWAIPFAFLLPRGTKRNARALGRVAAIVLAGRLLDVYLMVAPPLYGAAPAAGIGEIGMLAAVAGLVLLVFTRALRQAPPVPLRDPYLIESLNYHN